MRRFQAGSSVGFGMSQSMSSKSLPLGGYSRVGGGLGRRHRAIAQAACGFFLFVLVIISIRSIFSNAESSVASSASDSSIVHGLMIDAGSTGSRMHTFSFRRGEKGTLSLLKEDFYPVKPGLSSYKEDPSKAAASLQPLLERARQIVPRSKRAATPLFLRATAGLRMVGPAASEAILAQVRATLRASGFRFDSNEWARVLAGNDEAIYSWITVNYLMNRSARDTVGTLEMGGGSAQVAFAPRIAPVQGGNCSAPSENVEYRGKNLELYTVSHLKFGLAKARAIALTYFERTGLTNHPCINRGGNVRIPVPFTKPERHVVMTGTGDYDFCRQRVEDAIFKQVRRTCSCMVCSYFAKPMPSPIKEYVAFAYYLERTVKIGMTSPMTVGDIRRKGKEICAMSIQEVNRKYPSVPNGAATDLCLDLAYITAHLEYGHGISDNLGAQLNVVDKINGVELGWSLGAIFAEMSKLDAAKRK